MRFDSLISLRVAPPASEFQIAGLESRLGKRIPGDYRNFLGAFNGAFLKSNSVPIVIGGRANSACIQCLFGIGASVDVADIYWNIDICAGEFGGELVPIARDGSGGLLLLAIGARDYGNVYFWDYYGSPGSQEGAGLSVAASCFDELVDSIRAD